MLAVCFFRSLMMCLLETYPAGRIPCRILLTYPGLVILGGTPQEPIVPLGWNLTQIGRSFVDSVFLR